MSADARGTALVTGGARGIGSAACVALARAGFDVAVVSLEPLHDAEAESTLAAIRAQGRRTLYLQGDIANLEAHATLLQAAGDALGPLDCLVNNAGVTSLRRDDMLALTPESFDRCVAINLRGTFFLTQAVARAMIPRAGAGVSVDHHDHVGQRRHRRGQSRRLLHHQGGAVDGVQALRRRLARGGVHVFEVRPGIIRTDMTAPATERYDGLIASGGVPLQRWGTPEDVGEAIATVARGGLPFDTGEVLNIGGGLHLHRV